LGIAVKRLALALCLLLVTAPLAARMAPGGLSRNIFSVFTICPPGSVITGADPVLDTTGRTAVSCCLNAGERTGVFVFIGQSNSVNEVPTVRTPTYAKNHQLNIYDGDCYQTQEPLLGINVSGGTVTDARGTWMSREADRLIADGHLDRVVIVPMAVGATTVGLWADDANAPYLRDLIGTVARRIKAAGLPCTAIHWGQGESDTSAGTTQAAYSAALGTVIATFNRELPGCPILVARESYYYGATSAAVLAAQDAAVNGSTVFAGENLESIGSSYRYDNTHLSESGADLRAALVEAAMVTALGL
jgi:hypothetical protein